MMKQPQQEPAPESFDLPATVQQALVAWRDAYQGRVDISPHVKSQADCLLKILAAHGVLVTPAPSPAQLADATVVPLSAQYWHNQALAAPDLAERAFYEGQAYNHVVGRLYAQQQLLEQLRGQQSTAELL